MCMKCEMRLVLSSVTMTTHHMFLLPQSCIWGCSVAACTRLCGHHWTPSCTVLQSSLCWSHQLSGCLSVYRTYKHFTPTLIELPHTNRRYILYTRYSVIADAHPFPTKSELGGVLSRSHEFRVSSRVQPLSSRPSSQSWSPLQTRDWLIHWPAGVQETFKLENEENL